MPTKVTKPAPKPAKAPASKALVVTPPPRNPVARVVKPPIEEIDPAILEKALIGGDIGALAVPQRLQLIMAICRSLSLNHLTRPFEFTQIDGKWMIYARKDCTEQLRRRDCITVKIVGRKTEEGVHVVTAQAFLPNGREDESVGAVPMVEPSFIWRQNARVDNPHAGKPLTASDRAKGMMLAETKAKRRVTLSIAGLGIPDESELEMIHEGASNGALTAEETEKAANAKVVEQGGKVEQFPASSSAPAEKKTKAAKDDWREVECHIGQAGGPWLGLKVSEIVPKAFEALCSGWMAKLPESPVKKDAALRSAMLARVAAQDMGQWAWKPKTPAEAPASSSAPATPLEPQKPTGGHPSAKAGPPTLDIDTEKLPPKPVAWRSVVVDLPQSKATHGRTLETIALAPMGGLQVDGANEKTKAMCDSANGLAWLRLLHSQGIPVIEKRNGGVKDKILVNAIRAAVVEMKSFDDPEWLKVLDEPALRKEIIRRFAELGKGEVAVDAELVSASLLNAGETLAESGETMLRYIIENWETVATAIEGAK